MRVLCNCLLGALPRTLRDAINYLVRRKGSLPRANALTRRPAVDDRHPPPKKKRYPGCLAHVVSGNFYTVVVNRRQPNLYIVGEEELGGFNEMRRGRSTASEGGQGVLMSCMAEAV